MKKSQLRYIIREMIVSELTMVGPQTPSDEVANIAKSERTSPNTVKDAIKQAKQTQTSVGVAESIIKEMATFYKVKDKEGFKKALKKYKELKGDKYDKNALGQLLVALDKEGEVNIKDLAKEKGKDTATWNNPTTRASLEKDGGEFTDYIGTDKGEKETSKKKEEPKKKETPKKKEAPKSKSKKQKDEDEDEEVEDNWSKSNDDDETEDEEKIDKKAQAAAKKGGSNVTKLQRVTTQLKDLEKEMKELAGKWKSSEGTEKEKFLNQLKEKTKVKKELEKEQDKLTDLIG
jgi:hypothetical protein